MRLTLAAALLSFVAGALWTRQSADAPKTYVDTVHGFALELPRFDAGKKGETIYIGAFYAPPSGGMAPNVNVLVEHNGYTVEEYQKLTLDGLLAMKKTMNSQKELQVDGRKALVFDYEGKQGEQMLRHLAIAVLDQGRTLVATCSASKAQFADFEQQFQRCLASFHLTAPAARAESQPAK